MHPPIPSGSLPLEAHTEASFLDLFIGQSILDSEHSGILRENPFQELSCCKVENTGETSGGKMWGDIAAATATTTFF